jgi:hypothetical protein
MDNNTQAKILNFNDYLCPICKLPSAAKTVCLHCRINAERPRVKAQDDAGSGWVGIIILTIVLVGIGTVLFGRL